MKAFNPALPTPSGPAGEVTAGDVLGMQARGLSESAFDMLSRPWEPPGMQMGINLGKAMCDKWDKTRTNTRETGMSTAGQIYTSAGATADTLVNVEGLQTAWEGRDAAGTPYTPLAQALVGYQSAIQIIFTAIGIKGVGSALMRRMPTTAAQLAASADGGTGALADAGAAQAEMANAANGAGPKLPNGVPASTMEPTVGPATGRVAAEEAAASSSARRMAVQEALENGEINATTAQRAGVARPPQHHIFPQENEVWFSERGVDIDKYTVTLDQGTHEALHYGGGPDKGGGWWNETIMKNLTEREAALGRQLTPAEIEQTGMEMMKRAKIDDLPIVPYERS
jgi:hypothetical protein